MSSHQDRQKGHFGPDVDWPEVWRESAFSVVNGDEFNQQESCGVKMRRKLQEGGAQSFGEA